MLGSLWKRIAAASSDYPEVSPVLSSRLDNVATTAPEMFPECIVDFAARVFRLRRSQVLIEDAGASIAACGPFR
jgi:hypothetical protein